jgi:hypothetical protein
MERGVRVRQRGKHEADVASELDVARIATDELAGWMDGWTVEGELEVTDEERRAGKATSARDWLGRAVYLGRVKGGGVTKEENLG